VVSYDYTRILIHETTLDDSTSNMLRCILKFKINLKSEDFWLH